MALQILFVLLLCIWLFCLSSAHDPRFDQPKNYDYFGPVEERRHLKSGSLHEQASYPDLLQKLNYYDRFQEFSYPSQFEQLRHQEQQLNQQAETEELRNRVQSQLSNSFKERQQLNYRGTLRYPSQDQQLFQQGRIDQSENFYDPQLRNLGGELQKLSYHRKFYYPSQFHQLSYPNQDQQFIQQDETNKHRNFNSPELRNFAEEYRELNRRDAGEPGIAANAAHSKLSHSTNHHQQTRHTDETKDPIDVNLNKEHNHSSHLQDIRIPGTPQENQPNDVEEHEYSSQIQERNSFIRYRQLNNSGQQLHHDSTNQIQQLNHPEINPQQNYSSFIEHPVNSDETNISNNQSQLKIHPVQKFDYPDQINQSANVSQSHNQSSLTGYHQKNRYDSAIDDVVSSKLKKPETHLQLPYPDNRNNFRQQLGFENPDKPSYPESWSHPDKSQQPGYRNRFQHFNDQRQNFQPVYSPHLRGYPLENQQEFRQLPVYSPYLWRYSSENQQLNYPVHPYEGIPENEYLHLNPAPPWDYNANYRNPSTLLWYRGPADPYGRIPEKEYLHESHSQLWNPYADYRNHSLPLWHPGPDLVNEVCSLEKRQGPCRAVFRRYFYNAGAGNCEMFIYGGCYGNANNFFTEEECEFVCMSQ